MPAYNDTVDDFNLKWANTYALINDEIVYIHGAQLQEEEQSTSYYVLLHSLKEKTKITNFDFNLPKPLLFDAQYFNFYKETETLSGGYSGCLMIARGTRRQNKRSLSVDNTAITSPVEPLVTSLGSPWCKNYSLSLEMVQTIQRKYFPTYLNAYKSLPQTFAMALSPDFALVLSNISDKRALLASIYGFVGEADEEAIYVRHKGSYQEIKDLVTRNHLPVRIIDATNTSQ